METLYGTNNWKLTLRREKDHIVILRAVTCDKRAALPEELFSLPVTVLGDHALAPGASPVSGEEVLITCGPRGEWDNRKLQELTLPHTITAVGRYALYGCREIHTLRLHDNIDRWGGGAIMSCRSLRNLHLTRVGEKQSEALSFLCGEIQDEIDVTIVGTDGSVARLIFPGFSELFEENYANHHFDYHLSGGGYTYHHGFTGKQLSLHGYDELWEKYLRDGHDTPTAIRLAYTRLRYPVELSDLAREQYLSYLRRHAGEAILWQLSQRDAAGLSLLLGELQPDEDAIHSACEAARREHDTEALALLLEKQKKAAPRGLDRDFDL